MFAPDRTAFPKSAWTSVARSRSAPRRSAFVNTALAGGWRLSAALRRASRSAGVRRRDQPSSGSRATGRRPADRRPPVSLDAERAGRDRAITDASPCRCRAHDNSGSAQPYRHLRGHRRRTTADFMLSSSNGLARATECLLSGRKRAFDTQRPGQYRCPTCPCMREPCAIADHVPRSARHLLMGRHVYCAPRLPSLSVSTAAVLKAKNVITCTCPSSVLPALSSWPRRSSPPLRRSPTFPTRAPALSASSTPQPTRSSGTSLGGKRARVASW